MAGQLAVSRGPGARRPGGLGGQGCPHLPILAIIAFTSSSSSSRGNSPAGSNSSISTADLAPFTRTDLAQAQPPPPPPLHRPANPCFAPKIRKTRSGDFFTRPNSWGASWATGQRPASPRRSPLQWGSGGGGGGRGGGGPSSCSLPTHPHTLTATTPHPPHPLSTLKKLKRPKPVEFQGLWVVRGEWCGGCKW